VTATINPRDSPPIWTHCSTRPRYTDFIHPTWISASNPVPGRRSRAAVPTGTAATGEPTRGTGNASWRPSAITATTSSCSSPSWSWRRCSSARAITHTAPTRKATAVARPWASWDHGRHRCNAARGRYLAPNRSHWHPVRGLAMSEHQHVRADGTVTFLPHRLNRHTVVVRGLTADELWIFHGLSAAPACWSAHLCWVFGTIALAPTFVVLGVALGVFMGGILCRLKRGRPDT